MRLSKAWIIAAKDLKIFMRKKNVLRAVVIFPLVVAIGLPLVVHFVQGKAGGIPAGTLPTLLSAFSFMFTIIAAYVPTTISAYSLVGEKVERSLEPLLAAPITDGELLLGKSLAGFFPPMIAIYIAAAVFMTLMDIFTRDALGYLYYPNWTIGIILLLVAPLSAVFSVEMNVIISARVNDARSAQMYGALVILPWAAFYVASELGIVSLNHATLFVMSGVLVVIDIILFFASTRTFQREAILTKWT